MRILIVEDEFTTRLLLQKILSPYGDCDIGVNGKEAVEAFASAWAEGQPYDLILMDIRMPAMNGQEALQAIREKEKAMGIPGSNGAKIIMMTGVVDSENLRTAFMAGCEAYMVKPIDKEKLLNQIKELGLV